MNSRLSQRPVSTAYQGATCKLTPVKQLDRGRAFTCTSFTALPTPSLSRASQTLQPVLRLMVRSMASTEPPGSTRVRRTLMLPGLPRTSGKTGNRPDGSGFLSLVTDMDRIQTDNEMIEDLKFNHHQHAFKEDSKSIRNTGELEREALARHERSCSAQVGQQRGWRGRGTRVACAGQ